MPPKLINIFLLFLNLDMQHPDWKHYTGMGCSQPSTG